MHIQIRGIAYVCVFAVLAAAAPASPAITVHALDDGFGRAAAASPELVARSSSLREVYGNGDEDVNPGERVVVSLPMVNAGLAAATNVTVKKSSDPDLHSRIEYGTWRVWDVGSTVVVYYDLEISPAANPHDATIFLTFQADNGGPWRFVVTFPIIAGPIGFTKISQSLEDAAPGGNADGRVDAGEQVLVGIRLRNDGPADGEDVRISLEARNPVLTVLAGEATHPSWPAGEERDTLFVIEVRPHATTRNVPMSITISVEGEQPWVLSLYVPVVGRDPDFELLSFWLYDPKPGGNRDGLAAPGERLLPRVRLRNTGTGDGDNARVTLTSLDPSVSVVQGAVPHEAWPAGAARNNNGFVIDVSPTATVHEAMLVAQVTAEDGATWDFAVTLDIGVRRVEFSHVRSWLYDPTPGGDRDGIASPSERLLPAIRVRQIGPSTARGVRATLRVDDPDVVVVRGEATYGDWRPGVAITLNRFPVEISAEATPHDVTAIVTVVSDDGGPWDFPFVFPIAYRPVEFVARNTWIYDPAPGGNKDGQAEAGERILPRFRLRHVGAEDASGVQVRLTCANPDVTVVAGEVHHATWPAGSARNNEGFVLEVSNLARSRSMLLVLHVTVGDVTWRYSHTFAIVSLPVRLALQSSGLDARRSGIVPGNGTRPIVQLLNTGSEAAEGLTATVATTDPDITIGAVAATREVILPGHVWEISEFLLLVSADATPHDVVATLIVVAENGGPWRFEIPIPMSSISGLRVYWTKWIDGASEGGNGDGAATAGETAQIRVRLENYRLRELSNVRVTATVGGPDIVITEALDDALATWPPGWPKGRTFRFTAQVSASAEPHTVEVTITVTADDADTVVKVWTLPIVARPPAFEYRTAWVRDAAPGGDGDKAVNPGERVTPRVRIKNVGLGLGRNVHASLIIVDADVMAVSDFVSHGSWPAGEARNNSGFILDIADDATPHEVQAVLSVIADDAGPWTFSFTFPIVASEGGVTSLLANFPNPFNPETWIPFDLAEDADVTVSVYDVRGALTRRLDLGRLPRGVYRGRSGAAYWDGRNDTGEQVSSGVYLYELRAGPYRDMRRMVVRK